MSYALRGTGGRRHAFRGAFCETQAQGPAVLRALWPNVQTKFTGEFEILRALLAEQAKASAAADEAPLPVSHERFLTQPFHAP